MRLRADAGEIDEALADWWQEFSTADDTLRQDLVDQVREEQQSRPRSTRAPRVHRLPVGGESAPAPETEEQATGEAAPKKRRRRRRSGSGPRADGGGSQDSGS
jgi:poly(A) polymerase